MQTEKHRERLVELIKKSRREWLEKEYNNETEKAVDEYVADYLMSNNVVVLPLKVGDRIYRLDTIFNKVAVWTIARIDIYEDEVVYCDDCFNVFTDEEFGVREGVFLTLEEAENALYEKMLEDIVK